MSDEPVDLWAPDPDASAPATEPDVTYDDLEHAASVLRTRSAHITHALRTTHAEVRHEGAWVWPADAKTLMEERERIDRVVAFLDYHAEKRGYPGEPVDHSILRENP